MTSIFAAVPVISTYTRADCLRDGVLVDFLTIHPDVTAYAKSKFTLRNEKTGDEYFPPIAVTTAVYANYIALTPAAVRALNDIVGRAWDMVSVAHRPLWAAFSARQAEIDKAETIAEKTDLMERGIIAFTTLRVVSRSIRATDVRLKIVYDMGDDGLPVITIMLPNES